MEKRTLGKTQLDVSIVGYGASGIGFVGATASTAALLFNAALDAGINVIDTAECYGNSEELIGQTISHRRREFHLFTKCGHAAGLDYDDWDPTLIEPSLERSLERLKTDHVDLLQLHSCSEKVLRQGGVVEALKRVRDAGKTRFIGYSGDSQAALCAINSGVFDTLQTSVNIADQEAVELTIRMAQQKGMGVIAKRALANAVWTLSTRPDDVFLQPYWDRCQRLHYDFLRGDADTARRTALSFTLTVPGVHTALVGTAKPEHLRANLSGVGPLPRDAYQRIRDRWLATAPPEWSAADETRPVSLGSRVRETVRSLRRAVGRIGRRRPA